MSSWNYTFDDSDALVNYAPCADCNLTAGWAPWNSDAGGFRTPSVTGEYAQGQSLHFTYTSGASFEFSFHGTAIYLFGSANCTYDVSIDSGLGGSGLTSTTDVLFAKSGLPQGTHFVNVTAHASEEKAFAFDSALVTDIMPSGVTQLVPEVYDNGNSTLQYSGSWQSLYDAQIPSKATPKNYTQTSQSGASVALNFTGSAVAIHSPVNWGHWLYNVTLDDVPQEYNASTYWLVGDSMLFYQSGLDPTKAHLIMLINTGGDGMVMNLNDITVYVPPVLTSSSSSSSSSLPATSTPAPTQSMPSAPSSTPHHDANVGAIVGPVVAVVILLIAFVVGVIFWRRNNVAAKKADDALSPAPWYGGYSSSTRDPEKAGSNTLSMPTPQPYMGSTSALAAEPAQYDPYVQPQQAPQVSTTQLSSASAPHIRSLPTPPLPSLQSSETPSTQPLLPQTQGVDVNAIIELIAQRIDRPPLDPSDSPPQYPH